MSHLYSASPFAVRSDLDACHAIAITSFSSPGTWFSGRERREVVALARRCCARLGFEVAGFVDEVQNVALPSGAVELIDRVSCESEKIGNSFYRNALSKGLTAEQYVEIVGLVTRASSIDTFSRALGLSMSLLAPAKEGEPSKRTPKAAVLDHAWVPTIPGGAKGGEEAAALYGDEDFVPNILSALSLVPGEASSVMELGQVQYLSMDDFQNFKFYRDEQFDRSQLELVAGRISALNNCFY